MYDTHLMGYIEETGEYFNCYYVVEEYLESI